MFTTDQPVAVLLVQIEAARPSAATAVLATGRFLVKQGEDFVEVDLTTGAHRTLCTFTTAPFDNYMMGSMQFASGLLLDARVRPAGSPERGPWPLWLRVATGSGIALIGAVTVLVVWLVRRRRHGPV